MKQVLTVLLVGLMSPALSQQPSCDQATTRIADIQGAGQQSPLQGQQVVVKGVVTADFLGDGRLGGYFIQSRRSDGNNKTSDGLFIRPKHPRSNIKVGDLVVVKGQVTEQFDVTQVVAGQATVCQSDQKLPKPFKLRLPLQGYDLERVEGMRVTLAEPAVITDLYQYLKYGEMTVSSELLMSPTALHRPGKKVKARQKSNRDDRLVVDDGRLTEFAQPFAPGLDSRQPISAANALQLGQQVKVTGVMHYAFGKFKLQPTALTVVDRTVPTMLFPGNPGGTLRVATFNIENFFTSIDDGQESCGPLQNFSCRGADSKREFQRQLDKLVTVINTADAAVMGIQELENNDKASMAALVSGLNAAAKSQKWAYIDTGALGEDVIKVGLIYQPGLVKPKGRFALLNQAADPEFLEHRNRIIVAQTFVTQQNKAFNVATVHFKSKSCRDAEGLNENQGDGQGCYNPVRVQVAKQLSRWLHSDPTGQGAKPTLVVGDFNSYQYEDPMHTLAQQGFHDLAQDYLSVQNWTTSYRGTVGALDYVLVNQAAKALVTGLVQWHINSVAIGQFGYDLEPLGEQVSKPDDFYSVSPQASSDHDVVMIGLDL